MLHVIPSAGTAVLGVTTLSGEIFVDRRWTGRTRTSSLWRHFQTQAWGAAPVPRAQGGVDRRERVTGYKSRHQHASFERAKSSGTAGRAGGQEDKQTEDGESEGTTDPSSPATDGRA